MKKIVNNERTKTIYRLNIDEFKKGEWCSYKEVPKHGLVKIEYLMDKGLLIIHDAKLEKFEKDCREGRG